MKRGSNKQSSVRASAPLPVPPPPKARSRASSTRYGGRERLKQRSRFDASIVLFAALAVLLVFIVVYPLFWLLAGSLYDPKTGAITFANFAAAYGQLRYLGALRNSLILGFTATVLCALVAVPMAWATSRTDMPGKALVRVLTLGAFVTPPYLGALAWILLAGANAGWLNNAFKAITGAEQSLFNIFSFPGLVFIVAIYSYPYLFVFTSAALDTVSSEMEDA